MATNSAPTQVIPLPEAVDKYFELSLYLLVFTGFGTLASTGGLDLPTVILVGAALAVRGFLLTKRRNAVISERWTTPLTVGYFLFFAADYFFLSRSFLSATVHLALFAVVIRMFSLRRDRDRVMLAILSFLMVLASSVLTVDSIFLLFFSAFMLVAVVTFVLLEMRRAGRAANIQARHSLDPQEHRHLAFSLLRIAPALMLLILPGASVIFLVLPRMSSGYGSYTLSTDLSTGFSDQVQLGQIGRIQQSNAVIMHIQIDGDHSGRYDLHWRGVALSKFDGHDWSSPGQRMMLQKDTGNTFEIPSFGLRVPASKRRLSSWARTIHYRVLMEPVGMNVFFLAPWGQRISGSYPILWIDSGSGVYDFDSQHPISRYEAESDVGTPPASQLRTAGTNYPEQTMASYLVLRSVDPRVQPLALQIVGSASNNYDKAAAIERYLKSHYAYTLELPSIRAQDPIANFLFERKQGHCEYFASAMAVMLRTIGIPSRVVNGFRSDEFNDITDNYVVRAKDAHSWVEVFFPGYGWQTFDPTPGGPSGSPQGWGRLALYLDAMSSFWREWIVSYDASHQYILSQSAVGETRTSVERTRLWARRRYESMLRWAKESQQLVKNSSWRWALIAVGIALVPVGFANLGRMARGLRNCWLRAHPEHSPDEAAAMWYRKMEQSLVRRELRKHAAWTPQEFLNTIGDQRLHKPVENFTRAYESARFGNSADDAQRLADLCEQVEQATKNK